MTIGVMVRQLLTKLDWYDTLFPRIPVPIQVRWLANTILSLKVALLMDVFFLSH